MRISSYYSPHDILIIIVLIIIIMLIAKGSYYLKSILPRLWSWLATWILYMWRPYISRWSHFMSTTHMISLNSIIKRFIRANKVMTITYIYNYNYKVNIIKITGFNFGTMNENCLYCRLIICYYMWDFWDKGCKNQTLLLIWQYIIKCLYKILLHWQVIKIIFFFFLLNGTRIMIKDTFDARCHH